MRFWRRNVPTEPASDRDDPATIEQTAERHQPAHEAELKEEAPPAAEPEVEPGRTARGKWSASVSASGMVLATPCPDRAGAGAGARSSSRLLLKIRICANWNPNRRPRSSHPSRRPPRSSRDRRHRRRRIRSDSPGSGGAIFLPNRRRIKRSPPPRSPPRAERNYASRSLTRRFHPRQPAPEPASVEAKQAAEAAETERRGWFSRLRAGLSRSSARLNDGINTIFNRRRLDDEALEELEELLISSDMGVGVAGEVAEVLRRTRFNQEVSPEEVRSALAEQVIRLVEPVTRPLRIDRARQPFVILVIGVNGSGKTTTIAKLAKQYRDQGLKVVLAAGDTFRAAAVEQLQIWGERTGCAVVARPAGIGRRRARL